jgi:hypothetical protein
MNCDCCWFIQPDSAISRNRNGSRDFLMRKVTLSRHCTAVVGDPLQIYADRFSGHYGYALPTREIPDHKGAGPHLPAGHRSSIAFMISSAHRTASAIALIVAGTLFPPSNCASFRAARILAAINSTRLRPSSMQGRVAYSPFVRLRIF